MAVLSPLVVGAGFAALGAWIGSVGWAALIGAAIAGVVMAGGALVSPQRPSVPEQ
jgi:hypothetical protein